MCRLNVDAHVRDAAVVVKVCQAWLKRDQVFVHVPDDDPAGGGPLPREQLHASLTCGAANVSVQANGGAGGSVCGGACAQDLLLAVGEGGGSDLADDPGADAGVADPFGNVAYHPSGEFTDRIGAHVIRMCAFQVETRACDDFQTGLVGDSAQPGRVAPHIRDAIGGDVATAGDFDQAVSASVSELENLCQGKGLVVSDAEVVADHDRVAVDDPKEAHVYRRAGIHGGDCPARVLLRVFLPYGEVAEDVLVHGRRAQLVRVHVSGHGSDDRHASPLPPSYGNVAAVAANCAAAPVIILSSDCHRPAARRAAGRRRRAAACSLGAGPPPCWR